MLILDDLLVLLNNKGGNYSFLQSGQVLNLKNIHVTENATDKTRLVTRYSYTVRRTDSILFLIK